jgi:arylsulfatase A-like enzyme
VRGSCGRRLLALGLLVACGRDRLPAEIVVERLVTELAPPLAAGAVIEGRGRPGVRRAVLRPGLRLTGGGPRDALVAPPDTRLRFPLQVPAEATLRFSLGVEGDRQRDAIRSGVEFRVSVDGERAFAATLDPSRRRRHHRWFEGRVDLRPWAGRTVELTLETLATHTGLPLAGTAGWSHVRVVRAERRVRQRASVGVNVLLLLVDTLRADRLGIHGATPSPTPALDAFAARGLVFDVSVAQASWTLPSVASIFTGLHPRSHGAFGLASDGQEGSGTLLAEALVTIAELGLEAGVTTMGVSTNPAVSWETNLTQGFETFIELPYDRERHDHAPAAVVNRQFTEWLERAPNLRFFGCLHYMEPHAPYAPPARWRPAPPVGVRPAIASGDVAALVRGVNAGRVPAPEEVSHLRRLYDGDIRSWDDAFAMLLRELADAGVLERTIVIVTADHGEEFLEHGKFSHGEHLYDETLRVPLVIVGPGIPIGRRQDVAQGIDLLPTIAALLDLAPPQGVPGRNLLASEAAGPAVSEIVWGLDDGGLRPGAIALRTDRWKLIRTPAPAQPELYDLTRDPGERTNLAASAPETALLDAQLDRWAAQARPPVHVAARNPGLRERLRELGYVE